MGETVGNFKMKVGRVHFIAEMKPSERVKVSYEERLINMVKKKYADMEPNESEKEKIR